MSSNSSLRPGIASFLKNIESYYLTVTTPHDIGSKQMLSRRWGNALVNGLPDKMQDEDAYKNMQFLKVVGLKTRFSEK